MTSHIVALIPHPHTPSPAVRGIEVCVHRLSSGELALAAVIEDVRGSRSYWALRHPPGKPDFHHHEAFALELEP